MAIKGHHTRACLQFQMFRVHDYRGSRHTGRQAGRNGAEAVGEGSHLETNNYEAGGEAERASFKWHGVLTPQSLPTGTCLLQQGHTC